MYGIYNAEHYEGLSGKLLICTIYLQYIPLRRPEVQEQQQTNPEEESEFKVTICIVC